MRLLPTRQFHRNYSSLPSEIQDLVDEKLKLFLSSPRHPSLRVKKMGGILGVWELRVSQSYRVTFQIERDCYTSHAKPFVLSLSKHGRQSFTLRQAQGERGKLHES